MTRRRVEKGTHLVLVSLHHSFEVQFLLLPVEPLTFSWMLLREIALLSTDYIESVCAVFSLLCRRFESSHGQI